MYFSRLPLGVRFQSAIGESAVFTGLDLVVILIVFMAFFYATGSSKDSEFKLEPLTLLVVTIVVGMVAVSLLNR